MGKQDVYWDYFTSMIFDKMVRTMRKDITESVSGYGLTSAHVSYLMALYLKDGQTLMSLSHFLEMNRANSSRIIKSLEDMGLVADKRESVTSKNFRIFLTDEGKEVAEKVFDELIKINDRYFNGISEEDFVRMRNTLIRISRNMNEMSGYYVQDEDKSIYQGLGVDQGNEAYTSDDSLI